jgi:hypothetical protein
MNQNILDGMDGFIGDMMKELSGVGGAAGGITSMLSKLGNIKGNLTSALNFMDGGQDVFPFEVPVNEAVADYYTFCGGGAGQKQTMLPSSSAIKEAVGNLTDKVPTNLKNTFAEPLKNTLDVNLIKDVSEQVGDVLDMF